MKIDEIRALLDKYQKDSCTEEERKAIEEWYDSLQLGEENPLPERELEASLARMHGNLRDLIGEERDADPERWVGTGRVGARRIWRIGVAAAIILFAVGSLWWFHTFRREGAGESAVDSSTTVITARGETRQIVLPDGSSIQLNAGTVFRYPKQFTGASRTVTLLKGEAYFQVVTQVGVPFIVRSGPLETKVLGTSFDIRAYDEVQPLQIAVLSGKVCVSEEGRRGTVLGKGMLLRVGKRKAAAFPGAAGVGKGADSLVVDSFENDDDVAAWKEGGLYFKDASFEEVAFEISNRYNIVLINQSNKKLWSYTGLFRNESLQEVIETICQTENLGYVFRDNTILIIDK